MPTEAESPLGHAPIGGLLWQFSLPAIIGMTAASLYNVIDRIFIGRGVGAFAISGLALTLPLMNLAIAFGALVGAGASTLVSIRLGEKRVDEANRILGTMVMLNLVLSAAYSAVMLVFLDPLLTLFGASPATLPYARQFMQIILWGNVFHHSYMGLNNVMRASGYPSSAMFVTLATVGANLVFAPLFIFGLHLGIRGAALGTLMAQLLGLALVLRHFASSRPTVRFLRGSFGLDRRIITDIFANGMSLFFVQICASLVTILLNRQLVRHGGDFAVGAFGIINSVNLVIVLLILGLAQGMQPIVGYNFGAGLYARMRQAFHRTVMAASLVAVFGFILAQFFAPLVVRPFTSDPELLGLAETGMRTVMIVFPLVGFQMVTFNFFQSIGRAKISVFLTLARQVGFLIPALVLLPHHFGLVGVWAALPTSDLCASVLTLLVYWHQKRRHPAYFPASIRSTSST